MLLRVVAQRHEGDFRASLASCSFNALSEPLQLIRKCTLGSKSSSLIDFSRSRFTFVNSDIKKTYSLPLSILASSLLRLLLQIEVQLIQSGI